MNQLKSVPIPIQAAARPAGLQRLCALLLLTAFCLMARLAHAADADDCLAGASDACLVSFAPPGTTLVMHYYASLPAGISPTSGPSNALILMHGHSHDANKTFNAGLAAARASGELSRSLVIAPLLQVDAEHAARCSTAGVPAAQPGDLTWTCGTWMDGEVASDDPHITSFAALDAVIAEVLKRWPSVHSVTLAGFSAGGQVVQHYVGFSAAPPANVSLRFVVADPGSWLYFDPVRPIADPNPACQGSSALTSCAIGFARPDASACSGYDEWKYGIAKVPPALAAKVATARTQYAQADIHYLEGSLDSSTGPGRATRVLDRSCQANLQGPFRLQRGQGYAAYDAQVLTPSKPHPLAVVPGCAHDVACVFPSEAGRAALFGAPVQH